MLTFLAKRLVQPDRAPTDGCTTSTKGTFATRVTGVNSVSGCTGLPFRCWFSVSTLYGATNHV